VRSSPFSARSPQPAVNEAPPEAGPTVASAQRMTAASESCALYCRSTAARSRGPHPRSRAGPHNMARQYRLGVARRVANVIMRALLRAGIAPPRTYLLVVSGRRTNRLYETPVTLVEEAGHRWLVAPYGEVGWVRNVRAAGRVALRRGRQSESCVAIELPPEQAAPVLRKYLREVPITRPFFDVTPDSRLEDFAAEAPRHPVFDLRS
jgi:deazaflavin-dependent oxidoreductase (nitroreductase family)